MENLTRIREERGLTQKELGRLIGVAEATISNYENGKREPKLDKLVALADALNVSIDELVRGKEKEPRPEVRTRLENVAISDLAGLSPSEQKIAISVLTALLSQQ